MTEFKYETMFPLKKSDTPYRSLGSKGISTTEFEGREILKIEPEALSRLAEEALRDIQHLFRPGHLAQLRKILEDGIEAANAISEDDLQPAE